VGWISLAPTGHVGKMPQRHQEVSRSQEPVSSRSGIGIDPHLVKREVEPSPVAGSECAASCGVIFSTNAAMNSRDGRTAALPNFLISSNLVGSVFWAFAVIGASLSKRTIPAGQPIRSLTGADFIVTTAAFVMVRLLVHGVRLFH